MGDYSGNDHMLDIQSGEGDWGVEVSPLALSPHCIEWR
eukprot:CAMPEP_0170615538 /NCGR_PEP_ID=MMETSP0224-20130122/25392_1 /TAXON_ID=285029 /ORGANISM="Togula jolla, Strain CCCM 725" /LENGTH=37 /DNA_ID= /DNA_START= /DNA_END= /DNA_ORIENTATION=